MGDKRPSKLTPHDMWDYLFGKRPSLISFQIP
jgi:hypothetical protein